MNDQRNHPMWLVLLVAWATFFLYGAIAAPVPGVNEPHYICKAKHYWQPDWCPQDFFLASPNAHTVFYATVGSLTNFFTLDQSAWIGRALATFVLAWGWVKGLSPLFFTPWAPLWSAWIFLAFAACGNFSGEWLVGGVEGKVFTYGLLFAAFGDFQRQRTNVAAAWAGIAVSFHPVVGVWGLFAFVVSLVVSQIMDFRRERKVGSSHSLFCFFRSLVMAWLIPSAIIFVLALPGLIPVVRLITEPISAETKYAATYLQVYFRLAHHLDPMLFPARSYWGYAALLAIFFASFAWGGRVRAKKSFDWIVVGAIVFAAMGILIGYGPRPPKLMPYFAFRMHLLKFYPFRLADVLVPMAVAVSLVEVLERTFFLSSTTKANRFPISFASIAMAMLFLASLIRASSTADSNRYAVGDRTDWLDICHWIDSNLPSDALVQSPTNGWAFKWFARRAEYVAFKDCPQNAAGIIEWNRRLNFLQKWYEQKYADGLYSAAELKELRRETGLTHLLTDRLGPLELEPVYHNGTFQVYDLRSLGD